MKLRLNATIAKSSVNGPGSRYVIFFQGCKFKCPNCINPDTHNLEGGYLTTTDKILIDIQKKQSKLDIEGVTFTGGEPFLQHNAAMELARIIHSMGLSLLISTGYEFEVLYEKDFFLEFTKYVDVIIAGPYHHEERVAHGMIGSKNKEIILFTAKYSKKDFNFRRKVEIHFESDNFKGTGVGLNDIFNWNEFFVIKK